MRFSPPKLREVRLPHGGEVRPACPRTIVVQAGLDSGSRGRRVTILLIAIAVLSVADLVLTAAHLRATGMVEANPIAAFIINSSMAGSDLFALTLYKLGTVGVSVGLMYRVRRHVQGELGAWIAVGILTLLAFHWNAYARQVDSEPRSKTQYSALRTQYSAAPAEF